jgi:DNA repair protein RadD
MARAAARLGHRDVVIVDEAHLVPRASETTYGRLLKGLEHTNSDMRRVGLTATPYRLDQGLLTQGDGALFTSIAYRVGVRRLVEAGHLAPLVTRPTKQIDLSKVGLQLGEFAARDLELAANVDEINDTVASDVARALSEGRRSALVFATSVAHAQALRLALLRQFLSVEIVTGETDKRERARILDRFKSGEIKVLCNCDVLTTGFDAPGTDVVSLVRPTMSTSLYVQMVGRGMRAADGKRDCLVLDYGANVARHGPVDDVRIKPKTGKGDGKAPVRTCPECGGESPASSRSCVHCDHAFPPPERKATHTASGLPILSWTIDGKPGRLRHPVTEVQAHVHRKKGNPDAPATMRIEYLSGTDGDGLRAGVVEAREWVCVEHAGFARTKAEQWWADHVGGAMPSTVAKAVDMVRMGHMRPVVAIETEPDGEHRRVVRVIHGQRPHPDAEGIDEVTTPEADLPALEDLPF